MFLIARKPGRAVASGDLCPVTTRARLSYRRAAESFELATRPLANLGVFALDGAASPTSRAAAAGLSSPGSM